ncbi:HPr-like protein Crh [Lachnospiraceae bacterium]|jgi:phosphotransferase system HPr (HPr) family protein|nr:HPr family phosphocarrier protein [Lachnospiraceae bacterium]NBH26377.1 HPr family phosphocarrier protein [Lachnospiraceae bacterium]GFI15879.1 HPr-like protein Crh [Lachnospiraceae bacterium]GFI69431.1 HPr-like protein Crh [Lachnospiraceae bacterium]
MIEKSIKIQLNGGLEARPVAMLVQVASQHESSVYIEAEGKKVNAKSIMGMMSLALGSGESVTVIADGSDEQEAMTSIEEYLSGSKQQG